MQRINPDKKGEIVTAENSNIVEELMSSVALSKSLKYN